MRPREKRPVSPARLRQVLRGLSQRGAVLCLEKRAGSTGGGIYILCEGRKKQISDDLRSAVKYCLDEDLLVKRDTGWKIGANGRLALRRLLAGADPFAEQHQDRRLERTKPSGAGEGEETILVNDRSSPLGWLARRKDAKGRPMISKTQFAAGERLAQDFLFAGMMPRLTSSWSGPATGGSRRSAPGAGIEMTDNRIAARQRVRNAISEVGGELADILLDICCFQIGLAEVEATRNWPRRSGKVILQIALDRLAGHYGLTTKTPPRDPGSRIGHWGVEGYKPV